MMINIYPMTIKLGQIAKHSFNSDVIHICNGTDLEIRVFLPNRSNLEFPNGNRFNLTPNESMEIKFVYQAKSDGIFDILIDVVINESHVFVVSVTGEVVPHSLILDQKVVNFVECEDLCQYIDLYNPFNSFIMFCWEVPPCCFDFVPLTGYVPPKRHMITEVSYHPERQSQIIADVNLMADYQLNHVVKVMAGEVPSNIFLEKESVEFKNIPLNILVTKKIVMRNTSMIPAVFDIPNANPFKDITIEPSKGTINPRDLVTFVISAQMKSVIVFNYIIDINIKKNSSLCFALFGNVVYPHVEIEPNKLSFRRIFEHAYDVLTFKMKNKSKAIVHIDFEMDNFKDYRIFRCIYNPIKLDRIILQPDESIKLFIDYTASDVSTVYFLLPIKINDFLGPSESTSIQTQRSGYFLDPLSNNLDIKYLSYPEVIPSIISVYSSVTKQAINFSKHNLFFDFFPFASYHSNTLKMLTIYNPTPENVEFIIRTDDLIDPFSFAYSSGEPVTVMDLCITTILPPRGSVSFQAKFNPTVPGEYSVKLPVYVRNYIEGSIYNYINMNGIYFAPKILCSKETLCLEPVQLGAKSEYGITLSLRYHNPGCTINFNSTVEELKANFKYSRDQNLNIKETKYVKISFSSKVSKMVNTVASFECSCGASIKITIKACTENSILTTHAFVYRSLYSSVQDIADELFKEKNVSSLCSNFSFLFYSSDSYPTDSFLAKSLFRRTRPDTVTEM